MNSSILGSNANAEIVEQSVDLDDEVMVLDDRADTDEINLAEANPHVWRMLIVDDDEDMHLVTRLVLGNFEFQNRPLELISAYSGEEAFQLLQKPNDIALILLDVVMETDDAGLVLTRRIREELKNQLVRIVLRTGQSGQAPETEVVAEYDINDYKDKSELTVQKLRTTVISALRSYKNMIVLEQAIKERDAIDKLKSEFISTVSHELRTPLTSIRGALGILASGALSPLPPKAQNLVDVALRNSERLSVLVNDILDVEKLSSGTLHLNIQWIELVAMTQIVLEDNHNHAPENTVRFRLADHPKDAWVKADANRLHQVFANLLSNAVRFSEENGEVTVSISTNAKSVRVEIKDSGIGIPSDFQDRVFSKFAQANSGDTRQQGGTGLGLSICKGLIEKMGGTINFTSQEDIGSTFWFELPLN
jgi:signal transduction histidine kinase